MSRVEVSDDLRIARVYVRTLEGRGGRGARGAQAGVGHAAAALTKNVGLRFAPELRFFYDDRLDAVNRIEELLDEVKRGK